MPGTTGGGRLAAVTVPVMALLVVDLGRLRGNIAQRGGENMARVGHILRVCAVWAASGGTAGTFRGPTRMERLFRRVQESL